MKKILWFTITLSVLAAFFASAFPDGLDFVSEKLGFAHKAAEGSAPMAGYSVPFLPQGPVSTAVAGILGVLIILSVFFIAVRMFKKKDNRTQKALAFICAMMITLSLPSFAARPLVTDDYGTVDNGKYELETGFSLVRPMASGLYESGLVLQLKRGFLGNFDLGVELPYNTDQSGFADAVLHAKLKLVEFGQDEGLSLRGDVKLTNGDAMTGLGSGFTDYGGMFILSKKVGQANMHVNAGYVVIGDVANNTADDTCLCNAAFEYPFSNGVDAVIEYTCLSCRIETLANLQVGGRWQVSKAARLDAGYSFAMNDFSDSVATAGLTAEF